MAKIAFLLMAHKDPHWVIDQARALSVHGDFVSIHYDGNAPEAEFAEIRAALKDNANVAFARRVRCGWGEWSLVKATLNLIKTTMRASKGVTHYFLMSGDCFPTKSRSYFDTYLTHEYDVIESHDFFDSEWIRTGLKEDRLIYRHWFNERKRRWWFYATLNAQRWLRWQKPLPEGVPVRIGSQWWALRASTVEKIMALLKERRDLTKFFRTSWIPDETLFQTLVAHVTPADEIWREPATHLLFSDYGLPVVFHADHEDLLRAHDKPMARKISRHAIGLRTKLLDVFRQFEPERAEGSGNTGLYQYLTWRGRTGQRYRKRFWEKAIGARRDVELLIVTAKLWHIGKEVEVAIARETGLRRLGYLFDEDAPLDVPIGNLQTGLFKRDQHRRAMLNMIIDALDENRLLLAIDPTRRDVIEDLAEKVGSVKLLSIDRPLNDAYVDGHAERAGLLRHNSGDFERHEVRTALAQEFRDSVRELRQSFRGRLFRNDLGRSHEENVNDICQFLDIDREPAERIAEQAALHVD